MFAVCYFVPAQHVLLPMPFENHAVKQACFAVQWHALDT
jgi:hypothetical protein